MEVTGNTKSNIWGTKYEMEACQQKSLVILRGSRAIDYQNIDVLPTENSKKGKKGNEYPLKVFIRKSACVEFPYTLSMT